MRFTGILIILVALGFTANGQGAAGDVKAWEETMTIPTYTWYDDPNPVFAEYEGAIYYPYAKQDLVAKTKTDRAYRAVLLENEYLKVTCLPELGGRIISVLDKTTNEEMFHRNNEIKPALIAMRGAWISGGIEWNPGPQGHTVIVVSPVDVTTMKEKDGSASLVIGNTEKMFRTRWTVKLTLHPGKAFLDEEIRIFNPTDGTHPYYFWNCTAFPNRPGTRFIYPMTLGSDHAGTTFFQWPVNKGKDLTWLKNYDTMTSIFAYECSFDFFGAYDVDRNQGIVSYANHYTLPGKKAWTWGTDDFGVVSQMALSDAGREGAPYIEVQSGPLRTQADYGMLKPHQEVSWKEYWYPVHGLGGGFEYATRDVAAQATRDEQKHLEVRLLATGVFEKASCTLSQGEKQLLQQPLDLTPLQPAIVTLANPPEGRVKVDVRSAQDEILLDYETPLDIPKIDPPDLAKKPARADGQPTADEKYEAAFLVDSQSSRDGARKGYEDTLILDPMHVGALCGLAELDIECGRFDAAEKNLRKAVARDPNSGMAWYLLGVSRLQQGDNTEAMSCGYKAAKTLDAFSLGYSLVGRVKMRTGDYVEAVKAFTKAGRNEQMSPIYRDWAFAAMHAVGQYAFMAQSVSDTISVFDQTDFVPRALLALESEAGMKSFIADMSKIGGEKEFTLLEVACFFADLAMYNDAVKLLKGACVDNGNPLKCGPLPYYYLAYYSNKLGKEADAKSYLAQAAKMPYDFVFPSRVEELAILQYAADTQPSDACTRLMLGYLCASLGRMEDAISLWEKAAELDPSLSTAWRLLGVQAWKKEKDLPKAAECYGKAIAARAEDQTLYRDLAEILTAQAKRGEAITLVEQMPKKPTPRADVILWLADAYLAEKRYDDCINLLRNTVFSNREGGTRPHDVFVSALVTRGKLRYESKQYEGALEDFQAALTYPENLAVGAKYRLTDSEIRYWLGKTLLALGRGEEASAAWKEGASQITSKDAALSFITVTATQDEYVQRCVTALEVMALSR